MKIFALGFGVAFGVAAWQQVPRLWAANSATTVALVALALVAAYLGGRGRRPSVSASATAVASSHSDSDATAQVANVINIHVPDSQQHVASDTLLGQLDAAPWRGELREEVPSDVLEGLTEWEEHYDSLAEGAAAPPERQ